MAWPTGLAGNSVSALAEAMDNASTAALRVSR